MKWLPKLDRREVRWLAFCLILIGVISTISSIYVILHQPLWEKSTLFLFLGLWSLVIGVMAFRKKSFGDDFPYYLLSTASGFLLSFGFPPSIFLPLIFIAFVLIFYSDTKLYSEHIRNCLFFYFSFSLF